MPRLRKPDLSNLTLPQIELGLQVVAKSFVTQIEPAQLSPKELRHLSDLQWESLLWAHLQLMQQRAANPLH